MEPQNVRPTILKHLADHGNDIVLDLTRSHGSFLVDAVTGREYLDFDGDHGSLAVGYNHPYLHQPDFLAELQQTAIHKPANSDRHTATLARFVETFARVAMPASMRHLFLIEGGGLAVENALKAAMDWKVRKNLAVGKDERGTQVIHFEQAFHGRTGYTMSLTNTDPNKTKYFAKFSWPRIVNPALAFPVTDAVETDVAAKEAMAKAAIEQAVRDHPDDICALIIEPIQCEGGENHFRPEFFKVLRELADRHDFLLIMDEVQTGLGSSGRMWAVDHYGVEPDLIAFGKKSQVCGVIAGPRLDEVPESIFRNASRLNSTWGGNLTDMVRARAYLELIERDDLVENAAAMGRHFLTGLESLATDHPILSNPRGKGVLVAVDLPDTPTRNAYLKTLQNHDLLALGAGTRTVRFRPSLNVARQDIDTALERLAAAVEHMTSSLRRA